MRGGMPPLRGIVPTDGRGIEVRPYDAQRLSLMALQTSEGQASSYAIVGALALYLDFTNLFLFLLRFTGNRRE